MKKEDIYVKVDSKKVAKKLRRVLEMFGEKEFSNDSINECIRHSTWVMVYNCYGLWANTATYDNNTQASVSKLKQILAKEHLKTGDIVVFEYPKKIKFIAKIASVEGGICRANEVYYCDNNCLSNTSIEHCFSFEIFKRYATDKEKELLGITKIKMSSFPTQTEVDKFAELKEAYRNGTEIEIKYSEDGKWYPINQPVFDCLYSEYRIRPLYIGDWLQFGDGKDNFEFCRVTEGNIGYYSRDKYMKFRVKDTELINKLNSL